MERSSGGGSSRNHLQQQQPPWMSWTSSSYHHHHQEFLTWPPRSYTCSFCKREFRSAQALGGHMNVHRRDRARLRQSPPWDPPPFCTNPNPNPNVPNLNLSPPPPPPPPPTASEAKQLSHSPPVAYTFASLLSPLDRASPKAFSAGPFQSRSNELRSMGTVKHTAPIFRGGEFEGIAEEVDLKVAVARKEEEKIKTEWIGLQEISSVEEGLDLELRLGNT